MGSSSPPRVVAAAGDSPSSSSSSSSSSDNKPATLRQALVAFYEVHNPSQLAESLLDEIVGKYLGKETQLLAKLRRRYGDAPTVPYLSTTTGQQKGGGGQAKAEAPVVKREEDGAGAAPPQQVVTDDDKRNLCSPHFDAAVALLHHPQGAIVPVPNALPLDNLSRCRHLLPPTHEDYKPPPQESLAAVAAARKEAMEATKAAIAGPSLSFPDPPTHPPTHPYSNQNSRQGPPCTRRPGRNIKDGTHGLALPVLQGGEAGGGDDTADRWGPRHGHGRAQGV